MTTRRSILLSFAESFGMTREQAEAAYPTSIYHDDGYCPDTLDFHDLEMPGAEYVAFYVRNLPELVRDDVAMALMADVPEVMTVRGMVAAKIRAWRAAGRGSWETPEHMKEIVPDCAVEVLERFGYVRLPLRGHRLVSLRERVL